MVAEAAKELGVSDINGNTPPSIRSLKFLLPSIILGKRENTEASKKWESWLYRLTPDVLLPMSLMAGGTPK